MPANRRFAARPHPRAATRTRRQPAMSSWGRAMALSAMRPTEAEAAEIARRDAEKDARDRAQDERDRASCAGVLQGPVEIPPRGCYACDAPAVGTRDRRPEGGRVEDACARHAETRAA